MNKEYILKEGQNGTFGGLVVPLPHPKTLIEGPDFSASVLPEPERKTPALNFVWDPQNSSLCLARRISTTTAPATNPSISYFLSLNHHPPNAFAFSLYTHSTISRAIDQCRYILLASRLFLDLL